MADEVGGAFEDNDASVSGGSNERWELVWRTESAMEAERAAEFLEKWGLAVRTQVGYKRHAAMNLVEVSEVWVEEGWGDHAEGLLSKRPDLFGAETSYSEPLRYRRGMRRRLQHASPMAKVGYYLIWAVLWGLAALTLVGLVASMGSGT